MKIEEYAELLEEELRNVQPIRNPRRLLPSGQLTDIDDFYRQQAIRSARSPVKEDEGNKEVIVMDEETDLVGRMLLCRGGRSQFGHEGAYELC